MRDRLLHFLRDDSGATAVEYAVMTALIIISAIGAITQFGATGGGLFENILTDLQGYL